MKNIDVQNYLKVTTLLQFVHAEQTLSHCLILLFLTTFFIALRYYIELY